ncbi:MAG TPA: helix-turn-helix domain-containing protein [Solirubrobacteraceae bacterium]|nr:helix-turn-helix domain-containing protein [Solirubrobacteraceae bacterium]
MRQFGAHLGTLRKDKALSQEKLAEKTKLHRTYIGKLEGGKTEPRMLSLRLLAAALDVSVGALVDDLPLPQERKPRPIGELASDR